MSIFKGKTQRDWEQFLRTASNEELAKERWKWTKQQREAKQKKLEIQAEVDRRVAENPPDPGQRVYIGSG